ncbi:hypothetical protein M514_24195, partial [Trichuris suis]
MAYRFFLVDICEAGFIKRRKNMAMKFVGQSLKQYQKERKHDHTKQDRRMLCNIFFAFADPADHWRSQNANADDGPNVSVRFELLPALRSRLINDVEDKSTNAIMANQISF